MIKKSPFFIILSFACLASYAQSLDSVQYIMRVDSIVKSIDSKRRPLFVTISDVKTMSLRGKEYPNAAYAEFFSYDTSSKSLLKVRYEPPKKEKFTSTFYVSNDSLIYVRTKQRVRKDGEVNSYYFFDNKILKKEESIYFVSPEYFLKQWARLYKEHKSSAPNNGP
jgi:hypothetical protein